MKDMKKRILAAVMTIGLLMPCQMNAQIFLDDEDQGGSRVSIQEWDGGLIVPYQASDIDAYVPLGSGLLVMAGLGGAYLLAKRHKDQEV